MEDSLFELKKEARTVYNELGISDKTNISFSMNDWNCPDNFFYNKDCITVASSRTISYDLSAIQIETKSPPPMLI